MFKSRAVLAVVLSAGLLAAAGCSSTSTPSSSSAGQSGAVSPTGKIAMVVHGGSGDAFWSDVKTGGQDAAAQSGFELDYQTSDDLKQQGEFITAAVAQKVQGLIVSIPSVEALTAPIKAAQDAGIPVVVINSGVDDWQKLGAVGFVGQDEAAAGKSAGEAMKTAGVTSMLCVNVTQVILAVDQRCTSATESFGGTVLTVRIDPADVAAGKAQVAAKLQTDPTIDGVLSLGAGVFAQSVGGVEQAGSKAKVGTFDVTKDITAGVKAGSVAFAIDQQPYIQGFQSVSMMALLVQKGFLVGGGTTPIASGPRVLTQANAG